MGIRDSDRAVISFAVTDLTDSITASVYVPQEEVPGLLEKPKVGSAIALNATACRRH